MATKPIVPLVIASAVSLLALTACAPPSPTPTPSSSAITIEDPVTGDTVMTPIPLSGTANTFEGALTVDALDADGNTMCIRNITATSGTGTRGTWQSVLAVAPPETDAPITLRAYELSAKDGSMINLVSREVTLSATHPAIYILSPGCGATASPGSDFAVSGRAFVFEAQFELELRDSSGTVALSTHVTAASGTEESDWNATLHLPAGLAHGDYDLVAFDNSAKDGSVENEFAIPIAVE
ncbi:MAG: hypothetical protein EPN91_11180 [Salinibacterium sp.]|nr:MAG: hypothetical protein EPN91_11180 [Salinibacterium sp.]